LLFEPLRGAAHRADCLQASVDRLSLQPEDEILAFLQNHYLTALWYRTIKEASLVDRLSAELTRRLDSLFAQAVGASLIQQRALGVIREALEQAGVEWLVFKGMALGRTVYADPVLRPAQDIDVLVRRQARSVACDGLQRAGFELQPALSTATHEISLRGHGVTVDLHWRTLRPGRTRVSLSDLALDTRRRLADGVYVPGAVASTVIQLVHPAVTEYVTGRLIRVVDLHRWLAAHPDTLAEAGRILERAGLKTAAWAMLFWATQWMREEVGGRERRRLAPSWLTRRYLTRWIREDPANVRQAHPLLARVGFSLMLNDTWRQRASAVRDLLWGLARLKTRGFEP
jgi:hypothetical protein